MLNMTTVIYAGKILEDEDRLILNQTYSEDQAEFLAQALAIATDGPVHVHWMTIGRTRDIHVSPEDIDWTAAEIIS